MLINADAALTKWAHEHSYLHVKKKTVGKCLIEKAKQSDIIVFCASVKSSPFESVGVNMVLDLWDYKEIKTHFEY